MHVTIYVGRYVDQYVRSRGEGVLSLTIDIDEQAH